MTPGAGCQSGYPYGGKASSHCESDREVNQHEDIHGDAPPGFAGAAVARDNRKVAFHLSGDSLPVRSYILPPALPMLQGVLITPLEYYIYGVVVERYV